jgi:hypothetical protein
MSQREYELLTKEQRDSLRAFEVESKKLNQK